MFSIVKPWQVMLLSVAALLVLAIFSVGYYHPDEHFQILEFAALKLHLTTPDNLPWEYHARMRPAIQPAIVVLTHKMFGLFGITNPFSITIFLRMLSGALAFLGMSMMYRVYSKNISGPVLQKWFLLLSFLLWFVLYNDVRFSSESWSGSFFIIGFSYVYVLSRQPGKVDFLIAGLLLGFSFIIRYQTGFLIAGFLTWFAFIRKEHLGNLTLMASGILIAVVAGILTDHWFYGEWVLTTWNYFQQNILADKVSGFGVNPWYFYFQDIFFRAIPPFSLVFIIAFLLFFIFRPRDLLTWTLLPFILIHCLIGHKETRFFYPLIGFITVVVLKAIEIVRDKWGYHITGNRYFLWFAKFFWIVNISFIVITFFDPADSQVKIYQGIYESYTFPVTLYYITENPYARALDIHYYKRGDLLIQKVDSSGQFNARKNSRFLLAAKSNDKEARKIKNKRLVWSTFPEWVKKLNVNNWVERTTFWNIYEIDNSEPRR